MLRLFISEITEHYLVAAEFNMLQTAGTIIAHAGIPATNQRCIFKLIALQGVDSGLPCF